MGLETSLPFMPGGGAREAGYITASYASHFGIGGNCHGAENNRENMEGIGYLPVRESGLICRPDLGGCTVGSFLSA